MGCKESKHKAVAEGNTIITPSSSRKSMSRDQSSSIKNHAPSLQRSRSTRSSIQKQDNLKKINVGNSKANNVFKENENSGYEKGTVNVSKVLENEDRRLKELNDQMTTKNEDKESIKGKNDIVETSVEKKENGIVENLEQEKEQESFSIPKVNLPLSPRNGEGIEAIITDGLSGTSAYYTPTENNAAFSNNTKTDKNEEKQESVEEEKQEATEEKLESIEEKQESTEEIKDTKSAEEAAEDNPVKTVDATPENNVKEAEIAEKNTIETDDATPENHEKEAEVAEKIKVAEAAVAALETLVKEADKKNEDNDATIQNLVKEAEEVTDATLEKPVIEADKSDIIQEIEAASTEETLQNPVKEAEDIEEIPEIELEATDATLSYPVIEFDKIEESLLKDEAEAIENAVKEIHEVADKVEEIPAKEAESSDPTNHKNQELVFDKTKDVQEKEAEAAANKTPEDPEKKVEVADQVKNLGNEGEVVSIHEENPVKELENMTNDEANTEEDTMNSSTTNVHQISTEDPDNK